MKKKQRTDAEILSLILEFSNNIEYLVDRFGENFETFNKDLAYRDSVSMNILQIGEFAGKLTKDYREATKDSIPWDAMKNMRNFFAHEYIDMDFSVIWSTAINRVPEIKDFCEKELQKSESLDGPHPVVKREEDEDELGL